MRGGSAVLLLAAAIAVSAALPYLLHGGLRTFIALDDATMVAKNPAVLGGLTTGGIGWAFTTFHSGTWLPLTWLSHMLDVSLFGQEAWGHHLTSVLLHGLNAALLFLALLRMTGAFWRSGFAAAFFGVHPLRVESVAWIAERKDVLSGLFFLLVLLAYERYARRGGAARYLAVLSLLALGLMAKPMLVTLPLLLLVLDGWPLGRTALAGPAGGGPWSPLPWGRLLLEKVPLLALSVASSVVTFLAQRGAEAVKELSGLSIGVRAGNALTAYVRYVGRTVFPDDLAVLYPHPVHMPPWWQVGGSLLLLALLTAGALVSARSRPYLAAGWLWFIGMMVPVIGLVQVGEQSMADRFTYLPAIGLGIALAWGAGEVSRTLRLPAAATAAAAGIVLGVLLLGSASQARLWEDSETLFRHTLDVTEGNWMISNNLGALLVDEGRSGEALPLLIKALELQPVYYNASYNLGNALAATGNPEEAIRHYRQAIRVRPDGFEARNNLGITLAKAGRFKEAIDELAKALRIEPGSATTHFNLGATYLQAGEPAQAVVHLREAVRLRPGHAEYQRVLRLAQSKTAPAGP